MQEYKGSCHCGAVSFSFEGPPIDKGLRCNCSICRRKGALMTPFTVAPEALEVSAHDEALVLYEFGSRVAKHYFCRDCGIYTFHETARFPGKYRINLGCIDELDSVNLPFDIFDGRHKL